MELHSSPVRTGKFPPIGFSPDSDIVRTTKPASLDVPGRDLHFLELLSAYRKSAGIGLSSEVAARRPVTGLSDLARAIASREVLSFEWGGHLWLPLFQFEYRELTVHTSVLALLRELSAVLDDWEMADWFVAPNAWLENSAPLSLVFADSARVLDAARALRFALRA